MCLVEASVFGEEPACPSNLEVLVVLFLPASYLSYLVFRRHRVEDNRELRKLGVVWRRLQLLWVGGSLLPFSLVCLSLRRGVDRHLLLIFAQILIEREIGDVR